MLIRACMLNRSMIKTIRLCAGLFVVGCGD